MDGSPVYTNQIHLKIYKLLAFFAKMYNEICLICDYLDLRSLKRETPVLIRVM